MGCLGADGGRHPVSWRRLRRGGWGVGGRVEFIAGLSVPVLRNLGLPERSPLALVERGSQTSPLYMEILGPRAGV